MPFKITIEADSLGIAQAALNGVARALAEGTGPAVLSDQAPSDIVQPQAELPFANGIEKWVHESPDVHAAPDRVAVPPALPDAATQTHPAEVEPLKKRGRKPKVALVEDVEPPPEVVTEEDEAEAEGAVDTPEPEAQATGISEAQLREAVRDIMDAEGIPAALKVLAKAGYNHVKDIPPADYDRVHAIVKARA